MNTTDLRGIPVLLTIFRRPDAASRLVNSLLAIKPSRIYINADGPRNETEMEECSAAREALLSGITWNAKISTQFHEENLGLRKSVTRGISWFFDHEPFGIVLEEDCLPSSQFFSFVAASKKAMESRGVRGHIAGHEVSGLMPKTTNVSCLEIRLPDVWGWASWSSVWKASYPSDFESLSSFTILRNLIRGGKSVFVIIHLWRRLRWIRRGKLDSYAYLWSYGIWTSRIPCVGPSHRLVENIGIGEGGSNFSRRRLFPLLTECPLDDNLNFVDLAPIKSAGANLLFQLLGPKIFGKALSLIGRIGVTWIRKLRRARKLKLSTF